MNLDYYSYSSSDDFKSYEFYSIGPKGRIRKIVVFSKIVGESTFYNLAFGDVDPITGTLNDLVVTDNDDRELVLATVAHAVVDFSNHYGNYFIYAEGSTPVRTRLYQMSIARLWDEISINFDVYGLNNDRWLRFETNVNYEAFFVRKK